jgi:hypothetical protein
LCAGSVIGLNEVPYFQLSNAVCKTANVQVAVYIEIWGIYFGCVGQGYTEAGAVSCKLGTRQTWFSFLDSPMAEAHCCLLSRHDDDSMSTV